MLDQPIQIEDLRSSFLNLSTESVDNCDLYLDSVLKTHFKLVAVRIDIDKK